MEVNPALCQLLGYDAETLTQKTWQDLTPPEYLAVGQEERDALFAAGWIPTASSSSTSMPMVIGSGRTCR